MAMGWLFLLLALALLTAALVPKARRRIGWGRSGNAGRLAIFGWTAWIGSCLLISGIGFGWLPEIAAFAVVPLVMVAGIVDSRRRVRD